MNQLPGFLEWKEVFVSQDKGNRLVHYYFKDINGGSILAVVGTERSVRHMVYVVADEFVQVYGVERCITPGFKWRSKREVVDWLTSSLKHSSAQIDYSNLQKNDARQILRSPDFTMRGFDIPRDHLSNHTGQNVSNLETESQGSDIFWSGDSWICSKQLTHYPSFCRNGITIEIQSFVFVMAKEDGHYLAYLEDMYEDRKGYKKVKARWFHDYKEVSRVITLPNTHSREVFITPHAQVISAECVDGPATVLTPEHFAKCSAIIPHSSSLIIHLCSRQFRKNKIKPFDVSRLRGYFNQKILLSLDEVEELGQGGSQKQGAKRTRSYRGREKFVTNSYGLQISAQRSPITTSGPVCQNLKFGFSGKGQMTFKNPDTHTSPFKISDKIELLCQDSGIRGCWFKCTILQLTRKQFKVQYDDVQDEDGCGNLEEWIPAFRVAAPDKLGMRCSGRLTVRPFPPIQDLTNVVFEIGSPVDARWNDGWWEGVVTGIDTSGDGNLQVYFPGEDIFSTFQRKDLRISKDWVRNQWVDIGAKLDILSCISADVSPGLKLSVGSTVAKGSESGSSGMSERDVPRVLKLDTVEEGNQELTDSAIPADDVEDPELANSKKRPRIEDEGRGDDSCNKDNKESKDKDEDEDEDGDGDGADCDDAERDAMEDNGEDTGNKGDTEGVDAGLAEVAA